MTKKWYQHVVCQVKEYDVNVWHLITMLTVDVNYLLTANLKILPL